MPNHCLTNFESFNFFPHFYRCFSAEIFADVPVISDALHAIDDKLSLLMSSVLFNLYTQEAVEDYADFGRDR